MDLRQLIGRTPMSATSLELHAALCLVRVAIGDERRPQTMAHCSDGVKANIPCFVRLPDCRVFQVHVSKNARGQDCLLKVSSSSSEQDNTRVSADGAGSPVSSTAELTQILQQVTRNTSSELLC